MKTVGSVAATGCFTRFYALHFEVISFYSINQWHNTMGKIILHENGRALMLNSSSHGTIYFQKEVPRTGS